MIKCFYLQLTRGIKQVERTQEKEKMSYLHVSVCPFIILKETA